MRHKPLRMVLLGLFLFSLVARPTFADEPPLFSLRLAQSQPKKGWTKMTIPAHHNQPAEVVYVSPDIIITDADVKTAKAEDSPFKGQPQIAIILTEAGGKKMRKATAAAMQDYRAKRAEAERDPDVVPDADAPEVAPAEAKEAPKVKRPKVPEPRKAESDPDAVPDGDAPEEAPAEAKEAPKIRPAGDRIPEPRLAWIREGKLLFAPKLMAEISDQCVMTGGFTKAEAKRIAKALQTKQKQ